MFNGMFGRIKKL